jgi:hypothetical protein
MAREIAERVNSMRRYQLSALVAADERDKELERVTKVGKENAQLAEELEKNQRNPETRQIAANMRTLNERYVRSHEQVVALGKEGKLDAMRELIQGEARSAQRELAAESEKFIKIQSERQAQAEKTMEAAHTLAQRLMLGLLVVGVALGIGIAFLVTSRITGQLGGEPEYARQLVQRIADGDLSQDLALQNGDTQSLMALPAADAVAIADDVEEHRQYRGQHRGRGADAGRVVAAGSGRFALGQRLGGLDGGGGRGDVGEHQSGGGQCPRCAENGKPCGRAVGQRWRRDRAGDQRHQPHRRHRPPDFRGDAHPR